MDDRELLGSIDRHLERHERLYADWKQFTADIYADIRAFAADQLTRIDRVTEPRAAATRRMAESLDLLVGEVHGLVGEVHGLVGEIHGVVEEVQGFRRESKMGIDAHSQALARIFDRLGPGEAGV